MPPALLLLRFRRPRRFVLPLPVFLLWPLFLVAWLVLGTAWVVTIPLGRRRPAFLAAGVMLLQVLGELHGTRIDFRGRDATVYMQFI
jgi:hypothetical protein